MTYRGLIAKHSILAITAADISADCNWLPVRRAKALILLAYTAGKLDEQEREIAFRQEKLEKKEG